MFWCFGVSEALPLRQQTWIIASATVTSSCRPEDERLKGFVGLVFDRWTELKAETEKASCCSGECLLSLETYFHLYRSVIHV